MLHGRPDKDSHLDTILYEYHMLRHCANTLAARRLDSLTLKKPWANIIWELMASLFTSGISSLSLRQTILSQRWLQGRLKLV